ncbi:TonB-dependent receptor [Acidicapsa ligni]|uniref:TonB-dependent receptor n=1 Tax=Acidicapsa ligni TaxID=542300 RepID=UPI0021DFAA53|nr:TonB-dependent receptor [Acidicapsa ligni]
MAGRPSLRLNLFHSSLLFLLLLLPVATWAQNAQITGTVIDPSKAVIANASIEIVDTATQLKWDTKSNEDGRYTAPPLPAGTFRITVQVPNFETQVLENVKLNVAGKVSLDFVLHPGAISQSVTVDGSGININTTDASVSTVVDRQFVENLPLNGRSFQSLMTLAPGVSIVPSQGVGQSGELSVNGQRTEANYFTVDGVSANTGASVSPSGFTGAGFTGATPGETALGTTQSLVSIDALQEFRAITSTYSAEYGRTAGGQFALYTRSGTNQYHGTLFDYLRNDALDANSWFNGYTNTPPIAKQALRQNDFGGTIGGFLDIPHLYNGRDKTFFFFSYEGLRLINPTPSQLYEVPSTALRQAAPAALKPFLAAFPVSSEPDNGNGLSYYNAGYSAPSSLDTSSIRIDHSFGDNFKIFGRYSDSPSDSTARQSSDLAQVNATIRNVKTVTLGATNVFGPKMNNELRFNVTGNDYKSARTLDNFGGATPLNEGGVPGLQSGSWLTFFLFYDLYPYYLLEPQSNRQRQVNFVDTFTQTLGRHTLKYGVDYRRLVSSEELPSQWEVGFYYDEASVLSNQAGGINFYNQTINMKAVYPNTSLFVQDEWKVNDRLSLSYGLRWELNPAPHDANGNTPYTVNQITDLSTVTLAPKGTPLWQTVHTNFAPRLGVAYQVHHAPGADTILRAGAGLYYDTGTELAADGYYGVGTTGFKSFNGDAFPLTTQQIATVPTPSAAPPYNVAVWGFDPHLKTPYTVQWNVAVEQQLGEQQTLNINYVASASRRLLTQNFYSPDLLGNPNFVSGNGLYLTTNRASSDYESLQARFQRTLAHGFQALLSYTWSHSLDNSSSNFTIYELERGPSDFDIRNNFQAALSYEIPGHYQNAWTSYVLGHWALDARISARSALPVDIISSTTIDSDSGTGLNFHPDRVTDQPLYIRNPQIATGRQINPTAFVEKDDANGNVIEGNAGRNSARGYDAVQADMTLRRDFPFTERVGLQFRAEAYNLFNHPSFGSIYTSLANGSLFGQAYTTEDTQLGGLSSIYQVGGARSMQVSLKLHF